MEAFQGFCRAKTNLYIFQKLAPDSAPGDDEIVDFINPQTCGIYKNGSQRFKVDAAGRRTNVIDNELLDMAGEYSAGHSQFAVPLP